MTPRSAAALALLAVLAVGPARAADEKTAAKPAAAGALVRNTLKVAQPEIEAGMPVSAELSIENQSTGTAPVPDTFDLPKLLRLAGADGKEYEPAKPERFGGPRAKELGPGGFAGVTFDAATLFPQLATPGEYTLFVRRGTERTNDVKIRVIPAFNPAAKYRLNMSLGGVDVGIELFAKDAPVAVHNVVSLARVGFFDGADVPRVEQGVMVAIHGPVTPKHRIVPFEKTKAEYLAGTVLVEAAGSERDRANFPNLIVLLAPAPAWQGRYTVVGQVVSGLDALRKFAELPTSGKTGSPPFRPAMPVSVNKATVTETK